MVASPPTRTLSLVAIGCSFALLGAPAGFAHGIESTLERLGSLTSGNPYQLESRFSSGVPARDAVVRMVSPDGDTTVDLGHTNAVGQLTFTLPAQAKADWEVQVDAGPGHRDYIELPGATPATLQGRVATPPATLQGRVATPLATLAREARPLGAVVLVGAMVGLLLRRPRR
jgi:nickel transport protein